MSNLVLLFSTYSDVQETVYLFCPLNGILNKGSHSVVGNQKDDFINFTMIMYGCINWE